MSIHEYVRVIGEWCDAEGLQPWLPGEEPEWEVDGTTVGLFHLEGVDGRAAVHVLVDLGPPTVADPVRLLQLNLEIAAPRAGAFGLHAGTGHVVYRLAIPIDDRLDGATLPGVIAGDIDAARRFLAS